MYLQLSISIWHSCLSIGKYCKFIGQDAVIVNLKGDWTKHIKLSVVGLGRSILHHRQLQIQRQYLMSISLSFRFFLYGQKVGAGIRNGMALKEFFLLNTLPPHLRIESECCSGRQRLTEYF